MGRYITEGEVDVWKYAFGSQDSEQHRIVDELKIGEYEQINEDCDVVILKPDDLPRLKEWFEGQAFETLKTQFNGLPLLFPGGILDLFKEGREDHKEISLYLEQKTFKEAGEQYKKEGWCVVSGIRFFAPLDKAQKLFAQSHDYFFKAMVKKFIKHMEENPKEEWRFVGE